MVTYRHKIILQKIRSKIRIEDIQNAKLVLLFILMFSVISFFAMRIVETVNRGLESQARVESIATEVAKLEKENTILKAERETSISESEIEAQYRALGYKKPGEEVYIVSRTTTPIPTETAADEEQNLENTLPNWQKWIILIFN